MLLKDLYKTEVWKLASFNEDGTIPKEIIEREPTAELRLSKKKIQMI